MTERDVIKALHELKNAIKEWISGLSVNSTTLQGTPGPPGATGPQGPAGPTGPAGSGGGGTADYTSLVKWGAV